VTTLFTAYQPKTEDYWRGIVLFGRNVASYKFALAKALLEMKPAGGQLVKLEDLAFPFAKNICEHLKSADKQGTSPSSKFLNACRGYNTGELGRDRLVDETVRYGFNNVIEAFHVVGRDPVPVQFFKDERKSSESIRVTDDLSVLLEARQAVNLPAEAEARWRLVETAWELRLARGLVSVTFDPETEGFVATDRVRRRSVTSSRPALNGYQKGKCFYCFSDIYLEGALVPDVDHFFPHVLKVVGFNGVDGVWNLVLACQECNRGVGGKSDRVPTLQLLERLHRRNEFLIESHHPLRETLMLQTGSRAEDRIAFLNDFHQQARAALIHQWQPTEKFERAF
jgi:hypothetical protein